jgi:signal transduction histidine kinase
MKIFNKIATLKFIGSFRFVLFAQLMMGLVIIAVLNRWMSQNMVWGLVFDKVNIELISKELQIDPPKQEKNLENDYTNFFVKDLISRANRCDSSKPGPLEGTHHGTGQFASLSDFCTSLTKTASLYKDWKLIKLKVPGKAFSALLHVGKEEWVVVKYAAVGAADIYLSVPAQSIEDYVTIIWDIRDKVVSSILPVVFVCVVLLSVFMSYSLIRPLEMLRDRLITLESKDLAVPIQTKSNFTEFQDFVDVFNGLRERLEVSFLQASRFSADASHELRTPLTILRGYMERAIADAEEGSIQQIRLSQMSDEIERLIQITDKLLLLSRADSGSLPLSLKQVNFSDMLNELVMDANIYQDEVEVTAQIEPGVLWFCDEQLIRQLINNLYTNAINYNKINGWVKVSLNHLGEEVMLKFSNASENISSASIPRLFERFYRGTESHERLIDGFGLGLSLCQEIARLHRARLEIEVNSASEVTVTLLFSPQALA